MSEQSPTRTEHSRSIEDAPRYRALETLKEVGLLIPVSELDLYHGRADMTANTSPWEVNPAFNNGGNATGNSNVNPRASLYTGEQQVAQEISEARYVEAVGAQYRTAIAELVRDYSPERKREWIDRMNKAEREGWSKNPAYRPEGPKVYTEADLDDDHLVRIESRRLEEKLSESDRKAILDWSRKRLRTESHKIVSTDSDAAMIDLTFDDSKLSPEDKKKYEQALLTLTIGATNGSPLDFKDKDALTQLTEAFKKWDTKTKLFKEDDIARFAEVAGVDIDIATQWASAYNSMLIASRRPAFLASEYLRNDADIIMRRMNINDATEEVPFNMEYAERYFREAHIVGAKYNVSSATLGKSITNYSFFDMERTLTARGHESQKQATHISLGTIALKFAPKREGILPPEHPFMALLEDAHAKPRRLVEEAKKVPGFKELFEADAGNWEKFTLEEHIETVLRNFDENFADKVPVHLLKPIRLALVTHDIGKSTAAAKGEKHKEKELNELHARDFMGKLGIDQKMQDFVLAIIGDGMRLAHDKYVRNSPKAAEMMEKFAQSTLYKFSGSNVMKRSELNGIIEMCDMLQLCDGGAYTSMAVTRRNGAGYFRNAPSFNGSFAQPVGVGKRGIRRKKPGDLPAHAVQTPKSNLIASRVKRPAQNAPGRKPPVV